MEYLPIILGFLILVLIILSIYIYSRYSNERNNKAALSRDYEKLLFDNAMLKAEHLKFQLQPHTLNNILAHLKAGANKLNKGIDSLSGILEYILYKGENHFVSVQDEIEFIKIYIALFDLFTTEIDSIKIDDSQVDKNSHYFNKPSVPHLISAYFIENAYKHGDINHPEFLKINLKFSEKTFELHVINRIKNKTENKSPGIGLNNMKNRLELLLPGKYNITNSCNDQEYHSSLLINL